MDEAIINLIIESWRFIKASDRVVDRLDAGCSRSYGGQLRWFKSKVEDAMNAAQIEIVNLENEPYDSGMPVSVLNMADFTEEDELFVDRMLEPIVMGLDGIIKPGTVILRRK